MRFISAPIWKRKLRFISALNTRMMAPEKAASDIESKRSVEGTMIKIPFLN